MEVRMFLLALLPSASDAAPTYVRCWHKKSPPNRTGLDYLDGYEMQAEEAKKAAAELREPKPTPPMGMVVFHVERSTIDLAKPDNQLIIIESGGTEVLRYEPPYAVPETPLGMYKMWWTIVGAGVPDTAQLPLTVHLVDTTLASRCTWTINQYGGIALVK